MSRRVAPFVFWKHYAYGYEARLSPYGPAFARARMVKGVPGVHYELIWIHGPRLWRPLRVLNIMMIEKLVDRWVAFHRDSLIRKMPPDPMKAPPLARPVAEPPVAPDIHAVRTCPGCGRVWGMCDVTAPRAARQRGNTGWRCYRMAG